MAPKRMSEYFTDELAACDSTSAGILVEVLHGPQSTSGLFEFVA
jgi:hypothetical protein